MDYSIDFEKLDGKYHITGNIGEVKLNIKTPLTELGDIDVLVEDLGEFIEDAMWDVTNMVIQLSDEAEPLGIIVDMYKGDDDSDPITNTYWFDDYNTNEND